MTKVHVASDILSEAFLWFFFHILRIDLYQQGVGMMKKFLIWILLLFLSGCAAEPEGIEQARVGKVGTDRSITREMAAKTVALSFYTAEELKELETEISFSDVSTEDWSYIYIRGCVEQGFFAGSEEGTFRPQDDMTLWEACLGLESNSKSFDLYVYAVLPEQWRKN